ncbi:MAG: hypothetical protein VXW65_10635 [Pseudomonadota bacterium]|nr:hypothetical protein [Pseudomonadota bacterium]
MPIAPTPVTSPISTLQWWGEHTFLLGQSRVWQLGSLVIKITRNVHEWQVEYHRPRLQDENEQSWCVLPADTVLEQPVKLERYLFEQTSDQLSLLPRLADRSVVVKPINPIFIPAGQQGTMYVSTPLWLSIITGRKKTPIFDLPIIRPNDTWFGPDTLKGEICYATPVFGRTELAQLPPHALRAVTPVHFRNRSSGQLQLERMNLPVAALPLFQSLENGRLWTSEIEVIQESSTRPPRVRIDNHTPPHAGKVRFINPPRTAESGFFRIFDSFFD